MSIRVRTSNNNYTTHDAGHSIKVTDGHLHVLDNRNHVVAIYAPGSWKSADEDNPHEN